MNKLSVVLSVYNEQDLLEECLKSVSFADEIVVVNNSSTDDTQKIAKQYTKHVYTQPNDPQKIDLQKNTGFEKAQGDWILSLDADERVTPALADEIKKVLQSVPEDTNGYWIPRDNYIFGKVISHGLWTDDYQLRLFRKGKGKYAGATVHKPLTLEGKDGKLTSPLTHINYTSVDQYLSKMILIYTENEAVQQIKEGKQVAWQDAILYPGRDFIKTFFFQKGYKDGLHGLILSILQAFYAEIIFAKIWQKQGFPEVNNKNFFTDVLKTFGKLFKEAQYWIYSEKIETSQTLPKKFVYKILRRNTVKK